MHRNQKITSFPDAHALCKGVNHRESLALTFAPKNFRTC